MHRREHVPKHIVALQQIDTLGPMVLVDRDHVRAFAGEVVLRGLVSLAGQKLLQDAARLWLSDALIGK